MLTANRWRGWHLAVVAVLLGAVMACEWGGKHLLGFLKPAAGPTTFTAAEILSVPLDAFRDYAKGLPYDSVSGAGDEQRLLLRIEVRGKDTTRFYGPFARIEPVLGEFQVDSASLADGRVIARIWSSGPYPKLNLQAGWTYWWVDGVGGKWRSVLISASPGRRDTSRLEFHDYRDPRDSEYQKSRSPWRQDVARFVWTESDELLWRNCTESGCCRR